jgi:outer membrane protein OmpA-like peptidoglycan-associated protein
MHIATSAVDVSTVAHAQTDDEKKGRKDDGRRERPPERRPPPSQPPPGGAPKMERPPSSQQPPQQQPRFRQDGPPPTRDLQRPPGDGDPRLRRDGDPRFRRDEPPREGPKMPPPGDKGTRFKQEGPPPSGDKQQTSPTDRRPGSPTFKQGEPPRDGGPVPKRFESAPTQPKDEFRRQPALKNAPPESAPPGLRGPTAIPAPKRFDDIQQGRRERVEDGGRRKVIQEPGNRLIVKEGNRAIIRHDESERFRRRPDAKTVRRGDGTNETFYLRRDGSRVITIVDDNGRLLRRYRVGRDGREYSIIDNRRFYRNLGLGVGIGVGTIIALNLAMPRIGIPRDRYIVEYDRATDDDLYDTLIAPPVDRLDRAYALDEIRYNYELRSYMPRIDLDTITFEFGAWEVPPDQYGRLERIARAMLRVIDRNPDSVFFVEGHTDAVGSDDDNLSLSDRRASSVANILTDEFDVPPENLVTQGYGEQYLKVDTQGPERLNRRVTIFNATQLMSER